MDEGVSDRALIDVRGIDLASLLAEPDESSLSTALDMLLTRHGENYNGFNNRI